MARKTIIEKAQVVTMDKALGDFPSADILIEDGAIRAVGPSLDTSGAERIDGAGMIALPGIIDPHTCLWQTVLRGYVPDLWTGAYNTQLLPLRRHFTPEDNFNAAYVGAFEMLSYGTTTVVDYCHNISGPDHAPRSIEALKATGIRHLFTYSFMTFPPDDFPAAARFDDARRIYDEFHDPRSLTTIGFGVDSITAPATLLEKQVSFMRALTAPGCIHINEMGAIDRLHALGLLGPDLLVIHGNIITNGELELMAKARMPICLAPTAEVQGAPLDIVRRALDRGVDVVFGCDIPCSFASDTLGQLRVMFNVLNFLDGQMERTFTTVIGRSYAEPRVRLPGAGGAPEIAAACKEVIVIVRQSRRTFTERVDFVTSVGFGDGAGSRQRLGLTGGGPRLVITDLGLLRPDPDSGELVLVGSYPGVSVPEVQEKTGWDLAVSPDLTEIPPPTEAELIALRELLSTAPGSARQSSAPPPSPVGEGVRS